MPYGEPWSTSLSATRTDPHRRSRRRSSSLHPRDHGERRRIYGRARLGRRGDGSYRISSRACCFTADHASRLAGGLADRSLRRRGHCTAHCRWRAFDFLPLSRRHPCGPAGCLALVVRDRHRYRRGIFRARCAGDGFVPDVARQRRTFRSRNLGRCIHGRGLWARADRLRLVDRAALWRLGSRMAKSSAARQERLQRSRERDASLEAIRNPAQEAVPADLDRLIHERIRLGIVSALAVNRSLTFNELKALLKTTDGNLSVHARRLEEADYIVCTKSFDGRLPKTEYRLAAAGRRALERYLNHMEALIRATREG